MIKKIEASIHELEEIPAAEKKKSVPELRKQLKVTEKEMEEARHDFIKAQKELFSYTKKNVKHIEWCFGLKFYLNFILYYFISF